MSRIERWRGAWLFLLAPALVYLVLVFAVPMVMLLQQSVVVADRPRAAWGLTLAHYARFLGAPAYLRVLLITIRLGLTVTAVTLVLGYPLAYAMARFGPAWQRLVLVVVISPLLVSVVIRTYAWQVILRSQGPVNALLLGLGLVDEPLKLLFAPPGVVIGLVHVYLPFMVLPLASVIEKIDPALEEAAKSLGANGVRRFLEVVLPLSVPGMAAGAMLVFTLSVSAYVTPALLGGERVLVMSTLVAQQILVLLDWSFGSAIATILTLVTLGMLVLYWWLSARSGRAGRVGAAL